MNFSFDHLVWFYNHPEDAILPLSQKGINAAKGGRHESWGTYNSICYFDLSYIEFLGIENLEIAEKHKDNRLITQIVQQLAGENREGPAKVAIRTDRIDELGAKLKKDGVTVYGPLPGKRVRSDGEVISWSLLFLEKKNSNELTLPFFIQWEKTDEERIADLMEQGLIGAHVSGYPQFESVGFVVRDLDNVTTTWSRLFPLKQSKEYIDSTLNARCRTLELAGANLLFCTPLGEGPAELALKEKGETPFLVNLTELNQKSFFKMMGGYWRFQ